MEIKNCGDKDLDETNSKSHLFFPLLLFFGGKSLQVKVINFIKLVELVEHFLGAGGQGPRAGYEGKQKITNKNC